MRLDREPGSRRPQRVGVRSRVERRSRVVAAIEIERRHADNTEAALRESREQLVHVYEHVDDVLFQVKVEPDGHYSFQHGNPAFLRRLGLEREHLVGRLVHHVVRNDTTCPEVLDLNQMVCGVGQMLRRLIGDDVSVITTLQPGLWPVEADAGQLEQVIMNLAINARDAMPHGGTLAIATSNGPLTDHTSPRRVVLTVADTGSGMDDEVQARAFEPFFTTKPPDHGTGLGLSTVYRVVKQSGGDITMNSEPGAGTTFTITLPAC